MGTAGIGLLTGGAADGSGLLDMLQSTTAKVGDVTGSVQTAFGAIAGIVHFVVEHRTLFLFAGGAFLVVKAAGYVLDAWIKVRQAFF